RLTLGLSAIGAVLCLVLLPTPASWMVAASLVITVVALFVWTIGRANSTFWMPTLWRAAGARRAVALTLRGGPGGGFTPGVLDILAEQGVKASFLVVGEGGERHPELIRRAHEMGHVIGNHSHTHSLRFHFRHERGMRSEIGTCNRVIRSAIGLEPRLF